MADSRLNLALDDVIARLKAGASIEDCLAAHPEHAAELRPLLTAASRLREAAGQGLPEEGRAVARARLVAGIRTAEAVRRPRSWRSSWGRALLVPATALAIVLGLFLGLSTSQAPDGAEAATILTVLEGEVSVQGQGGAVVVRTKADLRPGDRVITGPGSRAVLTFLDGSTVALDPDTDVIIKSVLDQRGRIQVHLVQRRGKTWTNVPPELGDRQIKIDTPTANVQTSEAAFSTSVEAASGRTEVGAGSGSIQVTSGDKRTDVSSGSRTSVDAAGVVGPTTASAPPPRELVVRITGPAWGFITHPGGATIGVLAPGYPVNQIPGATAVREAATLTLRIPDPAAGTYTIGLHAVGNGSVQVVSSAVGVSDAVNMAVSEGQDWSLRLAVEAQVLRFGAPSLAANAAAVRPANVPIPDRVIAAATATAVKAEATGTPKPPTRTPTPTRTVRPALTAVPATPVRTNGTSIDSVAP